MLAEIQIDQIAPSVLGTVFITVMSLRVLCYYFPGLDNVFSSKHRKDNSESKLVLETGRPLVLNAVMKTVPREWEEKVNSHSRAIDALDKKVDTLVAHTDGKLEKIFDKIEDVNNSMGNLRVTIAETRCPHAVKSGS